MTGEVECRYYGRDFTAEEMVLLRTLIAAEPPPTRHALSREFCRRIGWLKPDGGLKDMMARVTMLVTVRRPGDWGPAKLWRRLSACWHARTHSIGRMRSYRLRVRCQSFRRGRSQMSFLGWVRLVCLS